MKNQEDTPAHTLRQEKTCSYAHTSTHMQLESGIKPRKSNQSFEVILTLGCFPGNLVFEVEDSCQGSWKRVENHLELNQWNVYGGALKQQNYGETFRVIQRVKGVLWVREIIGILMAQQPKDWIIFSLFFFSRFTLKLKEHELLDEPQKPIRSELKLLLGINKGVLMTSW